MYGFVGLEVYQNLLVQCTTCTKKVLKSKKVINNVVLLEFQKNRKISTRMLRLSLKTLETTYAPKEYVATFVGVPLVGTLDTRNQ